MIAAPKTHNQRKPKAPPIATDEPERAALSAKIAEVEAIKQTHLQTLLLLEAMTPAERERHWREELTTRTVVKLAEYVSARLRARRGD